MYGQTPELTGSGAPSIVTGGVFDETPSPRNRRSYLRTDVVLEPGRFYRVVARVRTFRPVTIAAPVDHGPVEVTGGLLFNDSSPCDGQTAAGAVESATEAYVALRFDPAGITTELADPVGDSLRAGLDLSDPVLQWTDLATAAGYEILRCDASGGPCLPAPYDTTATSTYTDTGAAASDHLWYCVRAARDCSPG